MVSGDKTAGYMLICHLVAGIKGDPIANIMAIGWLTG